MLSSIIMVIFGIYVLVSPFLFIFCIKFGYRMADKPEREVEKPVIPKIAKKKAKVSKDQQAELDYLQNIFAFNGTSQGQKDIER